MSAGVMSKLKKGKFLPAMKQTNSKLGDGFDQSPQVREDGDGTFSESNVRQDKERLKLKCKTLLVERN
jgi:hypothetical protein